MHFKLAVYILDAFPWQQGPQSMTGNCGLVCTDQRVSIYLLNFYPAFPETFIPTHPTQGSLQKSKTKKSTFGVGEIKDKEEDNIISWGSGNLKARLYSYIFTHLLKIHNDGVSAAGPALALVAPGTSVTS